MVYNLGHAVFEFIESRWGKEGIRQYLFSLRKSVIGGGEDAYMEAFKLTPEEFDQQFDKYLKDRFRPFRDKERPADYGRNLRPIRNGPPSSGAAPSSPPPVIDRDGTGNRKDRDGHRPCVTDGSIIRNLTNGFDQAAVEFIISPACGSTPCWFSWSPPRPARLLRASEKWRTLILERAQSRRRQRMSRTVDDRNRGHFARRQESRCRAQASVTSSLSIWPRAR
jgi:hypothetical protein